MDRYLSINEIATLFNVNRQTLHYYDKIGLFQPEYRDPRNGYRKYSYQQISQFAFITYLRTIGLSIEKIKTMINCSDIGQTMEELKLQSQLLEKRYHEIFNINRVIQRKLLFVRDHAANADEIQIRTVPRRAYIKIGIENDPYENEIYYHYPAMVLYKYNAPDLNYHKIFGALIELGEMEHHKDKPIEYIGEETYLCLHHKGPYRNITLTLAEIYEKYQTLSLSPDFVCINIVDQFLEKDPENFITEIQIPVDYIVAI